MNSFNIGNLSTSRLVDHLQNAVMEEDITYTVFWLRALSKRGLDDGAVRLHSWRMSSALSTICVRSYTLSRQFILQLLLSKTSKETLESEQGKLAIKNATEWARLVTAGWYNGGKERAQDVTELLGMRSKDAEEWINKKLPAHPHPESLTRRSPLPPAPGSSRISSKPHSSPPVPSLTLDPSRPPGFRLSSPSVPAYAKNELVLPSPIRLYITGFSRDIPDAVLLNLSVTSGVQLSDVHFVKGDQERSLICSVPTKAEMNRLIEILEKPQDINTRIHLALPRTPSLAHHHVLVKGISEDVGSGTLRRWAKQSRCGPFDERVGWLGQERVGSFRVETAWGADQAARMLAEPTAEHPPFRTIWSSGRPPDLSSPPPNQPVKWVNHFKKQNYARTSGVAPPTSTTSLNSSNAPNTSLVSVPISHSISKNTTSSTTIIEPRNSSHSPRLQTPSNENSDMEMSPPPISKPELEPFQTSSSPRTTSETSIDHVCPSPEPVPFDLPQPNSGSSHLVKALPVLPPASLPIAVNSTSNEPVPLLSFTSSILPLPLLDQRLEFANLVAKRLLEGCNLGESFLFSSIRRNGNGMAICMNGNGMAI